MAFFMVSFAIPWCVCAKLNLKTRFIPSMGQNGNTAAQWSSGGGGLHLSRGFQLKHKSKKAVLDNLSWAIPIKLGIRYKNFVQTKKIIIIIQRVTRYRYEYRQNECKCPIIPDSVQSQQRYHKRGHSFFLGRLGMPQRPPWANPQHPRKCLLALFCENIFLQQS